MHLEVAAYGWLGDGWSGYYPDDLPQDWHLDYYANEYRAIVVPLSQWRGQDDVPLREWIEEAAGAFAFYWELGREGDASRLLSLYRESADVTLHGGWLLLPGLALDEALESELAQVGRQARCDAAGNCAGDFRVIVIDPANDLRRVRALLDEAAGEGTEELLLVVRPGEGVAERLQQLQTLSQLYSG